MSNADLEMSQLENMFLAFVEKSLFYKSVHLIKQNACKERWETPILNAPIRNNEASREIEYIDTLFNESDEFADNVVEKVMLQSALKLLSPVERDVVLHLYNNTMNQEQLAEKFNVNQSTISRIKHQARKKLQVYFFEK